MTTSPNGFTPILASGLFSYGDGYRRELQTEQVERRAGPSDTVASGQRAYSAGSWRTEPPRSRHGL